ncbi:hypothetical protein MGYG_09066 [Nannizzia gypsea CBS 118893]|uniref:Uncharacterized protein n=1 Tax=Arthroderma gypseum (strain ATCC MYA-4604 / CBS 118893) TaxID=535722 RepID=E4UX28_ARTGP|nr:hypothetical protein MGYG_09066 [Nannizzia gypsea CBS 118893]EFR01828.1 hypothetical protein MGYG_09066 [Nannizzia gypsea CBS 118893]
MAVGRKFGLTPGIRKLFRPGILWLTSNALKYWLSSYVEFHRILRPKKHLENYHGQINTRVFLVPLRHFARHNYAGSGLSEMQAAVFLARNESFENMGHLFFSGMKEMPHRKRIEGPIRGNACEKCLARSRGALISPRGLTNSANKSLVRLDREVLQPENKNTTNF